jgi:hypothetical protein
MSRPVGFKHSEETKEKISNSLKGKKREKFSEETIRKMSNSHRGKIAYSKGCYHIKNLTLYDTYNSRLFADQTRRALDDPNILEAKCTYCGKWFKPKMRSVEGRIRAIFGKHGFAELRLYCSKSCKRECPIYGKRIWSTEESNINYYSREVQPELRQMVFERDNWTCKKCNSIESLHCHHIEGIRWEPLESADVDKCITYCKQCHLQVHKKEGCKTNDMKCIGD